MHAHTYLHVLVYVPEEGLLPGYYHLYLGPGGMSADQTVSVSVNSEYLGAECMTRGLTVWAGETWRQKSSDQGQAADFCGSLTSHRKSFPSRGSQPPTRVFHLGWTYRDGKQVQAQGLQQQVNALKGKSFLL